MSESITIKCDSNEVSDGYHTFGELYEHRIALFIALCRVIAHDPARQFGCDVWRSVYHSDGSNYDGWFVLGIGTESGSQLTYHLPIGRWDSCGFAASRDRAPKWDGHTAADVLERLKTL